MKNRPVTFIDLGAFTGDSVLRYLKAGGTIDYAHLFEPNPEVDPRPLPCPFSFYPVGAWIHQGSMPLYRGTKHGKLGASFYKDGDKIAEVPVINFPRWLHLLETPCPIVVKMNIEGAEYELLDKLCETDAIERIDVLYLAFHAKGPGLHPPEQEMTEDRLESRGLVLQSPEVYSPTYFQQWVRL
jgi:FkbM family methyltransferase